MPGDLEALRAKLAANAAAGGTAAVLLEPVGPESGSHPAGRDFNAAVRESCDEFGALLIFDEVVTGFRLGMGGAQGYFGVTPDLTVASPLSCTAGYHALLEMDRTDAPAKAGAAGDRLREPVGRHGAG